MSERSVHDTFQQYRRIRREMATASREESDQMVRDGVLLAVGILLGGSFPGSAAAVAVLAEATFPNVVTWPWGEVEAEE